MYFSAEYQPVLVLYIPKFKHSTISLQIKHTAVGLYKECGLSLQLLRMFTTLYLHCTKQLSETNSCANITNEQLQHKGDVTVATFSYMKQSCNGTLYIKLRVHCILQLGSI